MTTQCNETSLVFQPLGSRDVVAGFDGGAITSEGGVLLLGEVEAKTHILQQFAACFTDHRDPASTAGVVVLEMQGGAFGIAK